MRDILSDLETDYLSDPDPVRRAQIQMRTPLPKRFYKEVAVGRSDDGYRILLDGKPVKTPGKRPLAMPTEMAAMLVAAEFDAQETELNPVKMPILRLANTAIDGVADDVQAVLEDIQRFAGTDLLFYRADAPQGLVDRQAEAWDPVLDWVRQAIGARFFLAEGIVHVEQPRESVAAVGKHLQERAEAFRMTAMHQITSLTGSALLALAVEAGAVDPETAWTAAHVDEDWQISQWGADAEAEARRAARHDDFVAAVRLLAALDAG